MVRANDATQLAFCPRFERLNICSLHLGELQLRCDRKPPELLDERRARALSLPLTCYVAISPAPSRVDQVATS